MSDYRVCKIAIEQHAMMGTVKFDNKEDAEHYAKNQSVSDNAHGYEIQKNNKGDFSTIKAYLKGEVVNSF